MTVSLAWTCSWPAPKKPVKRPREWVPETHSLVVRNWNCAASGCWRTASMVANRVAVSTPLRCWAVTVMTVPFVMGWV